MRKFLDNGRIEFRSRGEVRASDAVKIDDAQIRAEIVERIALTPRLEPDDIAVSVIDGEVLLEGKVPTAQMRTALHDSVARCRGVRVIRDRLHISAERPGDAAADPAGSRPRAPTSFGPTDGAKAAGVAAELGIAAPRPLEEREDPPGPSLWWIAATIGAVLLAFLAVYLFI